MWIEWANDMLADDVETEKTFGSSRVVESHVKSRRIFPKQSLPRKGDGAPRESFRILEEDRSEKVMFPSTRYYGSKRRQLDWLRSEFKALDGATALDAFGGTGAVSFLLSDLGWQTTYNDVFEFNTISARALFSNSTQWLTEESLLEFLQQVRPAEGFITSNFEGLYFTTEENMWLDGFMSCLKNQSFKQRDLLLYCLFQACLKKRPFNLFHRANLNLRHSEMPVQFGNRATWSKSFITHIVTTYREVLRTQRTLSPASVTVMDGECAGAILPGFDLIYLDPPYFKKAKKSTETYLERYHFLEGLARYDEWADLIDPLSPLRAIKRPYKQEWTKKQEMMGNLNAIIKKHQGSIFALSYVADEEPTEGELFTLFRENFDRVRLSRRSFNRVLSTKESFEILLIGQ